MLGTGIALNPLPVIELHILATSESFDIREQRVAIVYL